MNAEDQEYRRRICWYLTTIHELPHAEVEALADNYFVVRDRNRAEMNAAIKAGLAQAAADADTGASRSRSLTELRGL